MKPTILKNTINQPGIHIQRIEFDPDDPTTLTYYMDEVWPFKAEKAYKISGKEQIAVCLRVWSGEEWSANALEKLVNGGGEYGSGVGAGNDVMSWIWDTPLALLLKYPPAKNQFVDDKILKTLKEWQSLSVSQQAIPANDLIIENKLFVKPTTWGTAIRQFEISAHSPHRLKIWLAFPQDADRSYSIDGLDGEHSDYQLACLDTWLEVLNGNKAAYAESERLWHKECIAGTDKTSWTDRSPIGRLLDYAPGDIDGNRSLGCVAKRVIDQQTEQQLRAWRQAIDPKYARQHNASVSSQSEPIFTTPITTPIPLATNQPIATTVATASKKIYEPLEATQQLIQLIGKGNTAEIKAFLLEVKDVIDINAVTPNNDTVLHAAVNKGNIALIAYLLEQGALINVKNRDNNLVIHTVAYQAASKDSEERAKGYKLVRFLVSQGADLKAVNCYGRTVLSIINPQDQLMVAIGRGIPAVETLLQQAGDLVDINGLDSQGQTPLYLAVLQAILQTDLKMVAFLLEKGALINAKGKDNNLPIHAAANQAAMRDNAYRAKGYELVRFLVSKGADLTAADRYGQTVWSIIKPQEQLTDAISSDNPVQLNTLLTQAGDLIDLNAINAKGNTPLTWAVRQGSLAMVELLISKGASLQQKAKDGSLPIDHAKTLASSRWPADQAKGQSILNYLISNSPAIVPSSQQQPNVAQKPDSVPTQPTVIDPIKTAFLAVEKGDMATLRQLADNKIDLNSLRNEQKNRLIDYAIIKNQPEVVTWLAKQGIKPVPSAKTHYPPLYLAAEDGNCEAAQLLFDLGTKVNHPSTIYQGASPLFIAAQNNHQAMVTLLLKQGADRNHAFIASADSLRAFAVSKNQHVVANMAAFLKEKEKAGSSSMTEIAMTAYDIAKVMGHVDVMQQLAPVAVKATTAMSPRLFGATRKEHSKEDQKKVNVVENQSELNTKLCQAIDCLLPNALTEIKNLLEQGANPNSWDDEYGKGRNCLSMLLCGSVFSSLSHHGDNATINSYIVLLLDKGADPTLGDYRGHTAYHYLDGAAVNLSDKTRNMIRTLFDAAVARKDANEQSESARQSYTPKF